VVAFQGNQERKAQEVIGWIIKRARRKIVDSLRWKIVLAIVIVGVIIIIGAAGGWLIASHTVLR